MYLHVHPERLVVAGVGMTRGDNISELGLHIALT